MEYCISGGGNVLPEHIVEETKKALRTSPPAVTQQQIRYAINHPFENVADAVSYFVPALAATFQGIAGFYIPLNRQLFSSLLRKALSDNRLDKLTIVTIIIASIQIPPAGDLKQIGLYLVKEFVCRISRSGALPGLENNLAFSKW